MSWVDELVQGRWWRVALLTLALTALMQGPARADDDAGVWLVTYGPGEIYWQRFGHNAIWIRDPRRQLDHTFNFGFFDFSQQDFFTRFLQGRMLYFSAAQPAQEEFSQYLAENRSIRAQRLNLNGQQREALTRYLLHEVRPENRDYLYDYYDNNCSTRVRDALDFAFDSLLRDQLATQVGVQSLRDHTRRSTNSVPWLYLFLEIGLGSTVDLPATRWDELFLPSELASTMAEMVFRRDGIEQPAVLEDTWLYRSDSRPIGVRPASVWGSYLAATVALLALLFWWSWKSGGPIAMLAVNSWLVFSGLYGVLLAYFWFATDHHAASLNLNLLIFNPLWTLLPFWRNKYPGQCAILLVLFSLAGVVMFWLPPWQYTLDALAIAVPANLAVAYYLHISRHHQADSSASSSA